MKLRPYLSLLIPAVLFFSSCGNKTKPTELPFEFETSAITVSKVPAPLAEDSTVTRFNIESDQLTRIDVSYFDDAGALEMEGTRAFNYTETKQLSTIQYDGDTITTVKFQYQNNDRRVSVSYQGNTNYQWDDSTVVYFLPESGSQQPRSATIARFLVDGENRIVYREQFEADFTYNGEVLQTIDIDVIGITDSIFVPELTEDNTNFDTSRELIFASDTVPTRVLRYIYQYDANSNSLAEFTPLFFDGFDSFMITSKNFPESIRIETYAGEDNPLSSNLKFFDYINDVATGELVAINEHFPVVGQPTQSNLINTYFYNKEERETPQQ